ncbi:MAG: hypothetical protein WEA54_02735, partial [Actinomycetota bacterium]
MVEGATVEAAARAAAAAVDEEEVLDLARRLIRAPSENPGGSEDEAASIVTDVLDGLGAAPETIRSPTGRPIVLLFD